MKNLFIIGLFLASLTGNAQKTAKPDTYAKTITADGLKKQLYIIAGPEMEGRETATPGQKKAAAYIESQFKSAGLQPGNGDNYQLYYNVYRDSLTSASLEVNGQAYALDKDFNPGSSCIAATMRYSQVVVAGASSIDSLKNANLAGKLVLLVGDVPPMISRRGLADNSVYSVLMKKGVRAIIVVDTAYPKTMPMSRLGRQSENNFVASILPQLFTISETVAKVIGGPIYEAVKGAQGTFQTANVNLLLDVQKKVNTAQSSDVIGLLPGTDLKDQYVVISAHHDHLGVRNGQIYYGADDDGSGTVGIIEIAKAFSKAKAEGKGPRRSLIFLSVSGEEEGLWGSGYYTSHPTFPLAQTSVDLNIDMIGRIDPDRKMGDSTNYVYVVGDDKLSSDLTPISEEQNNKYVKMELDYKYNDPKDKERIYYRSDHYNFAKNGVPIIFYYDGMLRPDYHKPSDTPDKINYELMTKRAQLVFYTGWEMANRNDMLKRDKPLK